MKIGDKQTVVVADDQVSIRELLTTWLEDAGYQVFTAQNGQEAMGLLKQHPSQLLVTDLVMPDQEGLETISMTRKEFPNIKILVISGFDQYFSSAQLFGANETMLKPIDADSFLKMVTKLIGSSDLDTISG